MTTLHSPTPSDHNTAQGSADKMPSVRSSVLAQVGQSKIARALAGIGLAATLYGCQDQNGNQQTDFIAPQASSITNITDPANPVVIAFDPQTKIYNLAFFANQTQVFEIVFSEPLRTGTARLYPQQLDANGNPTGVGTPTPTPGMQVSCPTDNPTNPKKAICTVTTDNTFGIGRTTAKMIPLKFNYQDAAQPFPNNGSTQLYDTVSAVPVVIPPTPTPVVIPTPTLTPTPVVAPAVSASAVPPAPVACPPGYVLTPSGSCV